MTSKHCHHSSKNSEVPHLYLGGELHSVYRSQHLLGTISATSLPKSLITKVLKPHRKHHSGKPMKKAISSHPIITKVGKSMSITTKDPLFDFDSSKDMSVIRSRVIVKKTPKTAVTLSHRRELRTEDGSMKSTPKSLVSFPSSDRVNREQFDSQVILLELKLTEQLKMSHKTSNVPQSFESQFPIYTQVFQDVIDRDKQFGSLLAKIKSFYDSWLITFSKHEQDSASKQMYEQCAEQLKAAKHKLKLLSEDKKLMLRRIGGLSKETVDLGRNLQEAEAENEELKQKMEDIRKVDLGRMVMDERVWKCLVVENRNYQNEVQQLRKKLKLASLQCDSLQTLVLRMKDRGFPIEELDDSVSPALHESRSDLGDVEPIVSGPPKTFEKPKGVPSLHLRGLPGEEETESTQPHARAERGVDTMGSLDGVDMADIQAFLAKEVSNESPGAICDRNFDDSV